MKNLQELWECGDKRKSWKDFMFRVYDFLYGLANPYKATVALFSTMDSQFMGFLTRLLVISLFHYFTVFMHMYLPTGHRKRGKCCIYACLTKLPYRLALHAGAGARWWRAGAGKWQVASVAARKHGCARVRASGKCGCAQVWARSSTASPLCI